MKNIVLFVMLLINFNLIYGQEINPDSLMVIGRTKNYTALRVIMDNSCTELDDRVYIDEGNILFICGIHEYNGIFDTPLCSYFKVSYKNKIYCVDKNDIAFSNDKDYFSIIKRLSKQDYDKFYERSVKLSGLYKKMKQNELFDFLIKQRQKGLVLLDWSIFDVSEYTEGTGVRFSILNPNKKTIKYIWFTVKGLNAVNDPVRTKNGTINITLKGIGPISYMESSTYSWDYIWFTDIVEEGKISSIKIQYMDGTFKTIENAYSIIMPDNLKKIYDTFSDDE